MSSFAQPSRSNRDVSHARWLSRSPRWGRILLGVLVCSTLSACDQLGIDTPQKVAERQLAEAKAIGSACRHALRAIEDCYTLNPKADKSAVFGGWREMDEYMRENKLDGIAPVVPRPALQAASAASAAASGAEDEDEEVIEDDPPPKGGKRGPAKSH